MVRTQSLYSIGMHEKGTGMNGYFYMLFVSFVALLDKQDESKRMRKFGKTMRDVARKSEG